MVPLVWYFKPEQPFSFRLPHLIDPFTGIFGEGDKAWEERDNT